MLYRLVAYFSFFFKKKGGMTAVLHREIEISSPLVGPRDAA